ncbi:DUF4386 domain-containing protein [Mucilaginibacter psychrotolerans]|uniref:DUF4386 domain-containing protein n=1 Tax=Mucilaginibacter psychrotolerans TaxID=1524096 RepID=A0A4Y8SBF8_9SPHI|nr:DUF4386 domain-containing protein [Mucilaginibacter psychrotolerans]TFF35774.1 DUF4386 domain-containing protein [Mucilaginibacter psychrotolerans]
MNTEKLIGILLISGAIALFIPYTILTVIFDYPSILRQETAIILTKFKQGGSPLIWTWFAFGVTGVPLIPAYVFIGQKLENRIRVVRLATTVGLIGLTLQMVGLLRWTFVVPVLANAFANAADEVTKAAAIMSFKTIHQFAGVILGEHLGQLCTIVWTVLISYAFAKLMLVPKWLTWMGYISSAIYLLAQADLFATVMPNFLVSSPAGFIGSTLWLIWLLIVGVKFLTIEIKTGAEQSNCRYSAWL